MGAAISGGTLRLGGSLALPTAALNHGWFSPAVEHDDQDDEAREKGQSYQKKDGQDAPAGNEEIRPGFHDSGISPVHPLQKQIAGKVTAFSGRLGPVDAASCRIMVSRSGRMPLLRFSRARFRNLYPEALHRPEEQID
ncbi:hypothetical protein HQ590_04085 [bacterium]|nr:hypothetical protein [bacterium]